MSVSVVCSDSSNDIRHFLVRAIAGQGFQVRSFFASLGLRCVVVLCMRVCVCVRVRSARGVHGRDVYAVSFRKFTRHRALGLVVEHGLTSAVDGLVN